MENSTVKKKSKRIFYFDALRALAILSVLIFHVFYCTRNLIYSEYAVVPSINWIVSCCLGGGFRTGVCMFLLLSGALSLGRVWDIKTFLGKRLPRIILPFLFWGTTLSLIFMAISFYYPNFLQTVDSYSVIGFLKYLVENFFYMHTGFTQYWFFWMILGTYLIMPVFNKWILHSDLKELEYFLAIWLVTCLFDYTLLMEFPIKLSYFSGPIGLVVLGYYLRYTERKIFNSFPWAVVITLAGFLAVTIPMYLLSDTTQIYIFSRYSILNMIQVTGLFLLFKNFKLLNVKSKFLNDKNGVFRKSLSSLAKYSYGIYLIHRAFLTLLYRFFMPSIDSFLVLILVLFIGTLGISWIVMSVLSRVPYLNQIIGSK